ncbi:calpain-8-like [Eleutherodactylus coqui]|uniref:calpain-8-like n=1 Tax=Eleutherodactylus coqui TaxID=57060 RepID=UPI0034618FE3
MAAVAAKVAKDRAVAEGLGTNKNPVKFLDQDYEELRAKCLASKTLFRDDKFPAGDSALGYKDLGPNSDQFEGIEWKRPSEIYHEPQFIIDGATHADIRQGKLGNCWFLAAFASLTMKPDLLARVVPEKQSFEKDYAGIFHFKFWQYGEWVEVVVDDLLPTKEGSLQFVYSDMENEVWSPLLEKAYAKLNGSYEVLTGGTLNEAMEDFTGGISEIYDLKKAPDDLYQIMLKATKAESLLGCSINITNPNETEDTTSRNLVKGHAYSITGAEEVPYKGKNVQLVRMRNPWGDYEWNGPWSDESSEWNDVDPNVRAALNRKADDGEFWMAYSDWVKEFTQLDICSLHPDSLTSNEQHKWSTTMFNGNWIRGSTAGGSQDYPETFWANPQFWIRLTDPDHDHDGPTDAPCCTIIVGLMQKFSQKKSRDDTLTIGYAVFRVPEEMQNKPDIHLNKDFQMIGIEPHSSKFTNMREVSKRMKLPVGDYLIVPSTLEPLKPGDFLLRIFSEKSVVMLEVGNVVKVDPFEPEDSELAMTKQIKDVFQKVAGDKDEVTAKDIQTIMNEHLSNNPDLKSNGLTLDTCRDMVSLMDMDGTKTLSLAEFKILWLKLQKYINIFIKTDKDKSGSVDIFEMRSALKDAGFTVTTKVQEAILQRYSKSGLTIDFDSFIRCMIHLESLTEVFYLLDKTKSETITLNVTEDNMFELIMKAFRENVSHVVKDMTTMRQL